MNGSDRKDKTSRDFEEIYVTYFSRMKYFALEYVMDEAEAENIVQDIFTELWEKQSVLSYHLNLIAFLFTAVKNRCIDHLRHQAIVRESSEQLQEEYRLTQQMKLASLELFDQSMLGAEDIERLITDAIDALPEKCRLIFIKSKIEGKKRQEVATELQVSLKTVENQMNIAYRKLREQLKDYLPLFLFLLNL